MLKIEFYDDQVVNPREAADHAKDGSFQSTILFQNLVFSKI